MGKSRLDTLLVVATAASWAILLYLSWYRIPFTGLPPPDWSCHQASTTLCSPDVTAPLTRKLIFFHPASAWAAFSAYAVVLGASIAYLNERDLRFDRAGFAAAEVGFIFNSVALATGTLWGIQEWSRTGQSALATVYTEPKVLVVVVMWLAFAGYLLARRLMEGESRRARLAAVFGIVGFLGVPLSFATSRLLATSLHPDILGPGANPDAAVGPGVLIVLAWSFIAFLLLFFTLWRWRWRLARREAALQEAERAL
ncbi:MAG: cytochrome c biogenesis protein CcsA [Thermoplasmatota archaeon]